MSHFSEQGERRSPKILEIVESEPRFAYEAYAFVLEALERVVQGLPAARHVTGRELCEGLRELAVGRFGPLAKDVLLFWGVRSTEDVGAIVFNLVGAGLLLTTDEDSPADFVNVFDFGTAFEGPDDASSGP